MLINMVPQAVSAVWDEVVKHIERSLLPEERNELFLNRLLEEILLGQSTLWISYDPENNNKPNALLVLSQLYDTLNVARNLNLLVLTRFEEMDQATTERMYREGMIAIAKFMKAKGYKKLFGHIDMRNEHLIAKARELGFNTRCQVIADIGGS